MCPPRSAGADQQALPAGRRRVLSTRMAPPARHPTTMASSMRSVPIPVGGSWAGGLAVVGGAVLAGGLLAGGAVAGGAVAGGAVVGGAVVAGAQPLPVVAEPCSRGEWTAVLA